MNDAVTLILVNGRVSSDVSARDRGLLYGDGIFRTSFIKDAQVIDIARQISHILAGCQRLGIDPPSPLTLQHDMTMAASGVARGSVRTTITRGVSGRGYGAAPDGDATRIVWRESLPVANADPIDRGVSLRLCDTRLSESATTAGVKTLNRLDQVLARREWTNAEQSEGLMCDARGYVVCGTMSNLFMITNGQWVTPALTRAGVAGTMREQVLDYAQKIGQCVQQKDISVPELLRADEVFLTNAMIGIWPVIKIDTRSFSIGNGTQSLIKALNIKRIYY